MTGGFGLGFAVLALLCQLLSMILAVPGVQAATGSPAVSGVICRAGAASAADAAPTHDEAPAQHPADCALCPVCLAAALPFPVPAPPAAPTTVLLQRRTVLPPVRAGPVLGGYRPAAQPRGPPSQA